MKKYIRIDIILKTLSYIFKLDKKMFLIRFIIVICSGLTSGLGIYASKILFDLISPSTTTDIMIKTVVIYITIQLTSTVINGLDSFSAEKMQIILSNKVDGELFRKCESLDLHFYENPDTYDIIYKAQIEGVGNVLSLYNSVCQILLQVFSIISILTVIINVQTWYIILIIIVPIFSAILNFIFEKQSYRYKMERIPLMRKKAYFSGLIGDANSFKEIKAYSIGEYLIGKFQEIIDFFKINELRLLKKTLIYDFLLQVVDMAITLVIVIFSIINAMKGIFSFGTTVAYVNSVTSIKDSLFTLFAYINNIFKQGIYASMYFDFLNLGNQEKQENDNIYEYEINEIEIKDMSFSYPSQKDKTLNNINFKITKGESIVLVGENGSGKSTLMKIIGGLYENYEGQILFNGISINEFGKGFLKERTSFVFQDYNKYEFTVKENIGLSNINDIRNVEKMFEILKAVGLESKLNEFENGLDTQLGFWLEGRQLSIGQWQRLAIARCMFRDSDLYLLDEATSSLDVNGEYNILKQFLEKYEDKMKIVISHKISAVSYFDPRIIVLKDGEIIADGKHEELYYSCDYYKMLYDKSHIVNDRKICV